MVLMYTAILDVLDRSSPSGAQTDRGVRIRKFIKDFHIIFSQSLP